MALHAPHTGSPPHLGSVQKQRTSCACPRYCTQPRQLKLRFQILCDMCMEEHTWESKTILCYVIYNKNVGAKKGELCWTEGGLV